MPTQTLTFRLDDSLVPALEAEAASHGCPRATYIQQIVESHLSQDQDLNQKLIDQSGQMQQLLRTILQDTNLLKQIVAQKAREESRDFAKIFALQKTSRVDLSTALAAILEAVCDVSSEEAVAWTKEHMNR